ncbi:hypothetical protein ZIOFF_059242 [Zingiber officinale]|uniref:MLO-like protein n=1 Tax=Zingiber officinale TaxID=94328 RepID=A0A8J5F934_ZINOF|nr:hypothetical protein ZIOFF_059242 [Zingiber officinale]
MAMWTAAVVGGVTVYWFVWVMGSAEVKGKRAVNLKMGSIMRDKLQDKYKQYWSFLLSKEGIAATSDDDNIPAFVDTFYNLVTDIYEWGWGQSFHFSPSLPGRSHQEATRIHKEPTADMRDGDLISQIPIRGHSLLLPFTMTGKRTVAPFLLLLIASYFLQIWVSDPFLISSFNGNNQSIDNEKAVKLYEVPLPRNVSYLFPLLISSHHIMQTCFFRQFGKLVVRADYLTLRQGFILNHNLTPRYDFHSYMIRSMEEEFKRIVGVRFSHSNSHALIFNSCSAQLWGFVVAFMLFNINGSNLYFWIAIMPVTVDTLLIVCVVSAHQIKEGMGYLQFLCLLMKLVLSVGAKLQHVIATLALESTGLSGFGARLNPQDDLFWFKKPELLLSLIHFILFQVCLYS